MPHVLKVFGPPGTGKTTFLLNKVNDELSTDISPYEVVYTSFTKAAALEARDRALVRFTKYTKADFPYFSTIHSICFRMLGLTREQVFAGSKLKEFCELSKYELSDANSLDEDSDTDIPDMVLRTNADYYEHFISWQRNSLIPFEQAYKIYAANPGIPNDFNIDSLRAYINRRNEYKVSKGLWDFNDFIEVCLRDGYYPEYMKVIVADEYQDTSPLLGKLLHMWSEHAERIYAAGDPYQCLYQFMAADPSIFISLPSDETVVLKQSYRCPVAVHDLSRQIVSRFSLRYKNDDFIPATGKTGFIFRNVAEAMDWGKLTGKTFYLHRTHWLISQAYSQLVDAGVPFATLRGKQSPIQSARAKMLATLYRLLEWKPIPITEMARLMNYLPTKTIKYSFLRVGAKTECRQMAKDKPDKMVTIREMPQLGFTTDFMSFLNKKSILEPFRLPDSEKAYFSKIISKYGIDALDSEPSLLLSTIHGVKGKECDNVILNLQLTRRTYDSFVNSPDPEHRLFYVGVTRSKNTVTLLEPDDFQSYQL